MELRPQPDGDGDSDESEAGTWPRQQPPKLENMANFVDEGARDGAGSTHGGSIRGSEMGYLRAQVAWYPEVIWT